MLKVIIMFKRKPGMTPEAFRDYRRGPHRALALKVPGLRGLVEGNVLPEQYAQGEPPIDGCSILHYDSLEALQQSNQSPQARAVLIDRANYQAPNSLMRALVEEHVIVDGAIAPGNIKLFAWLWPLAGLSLEQFRQHWLEVHAPLGAALPHIRRYTVDLVLPHSPEPRPCAGFAELWYDSPEELGSDRASADWKALNEDALKMRDADSQKLVLMRDEVVVLS